jgi:imidazolonepropionase-like amidohydrolase
MMRLTGDPMGRMNVLMCCALLGSAGSLAVRSQPRGPAGAALYSGARLIVGDGSVIEDGAFLVRDGQIAAIGSKGALDPPAGAARLDLTGKTVMPAMINAHVHIGYEGYTSWGAENYTAPNVLDHLEREAFYGVAATQSVGSSPLEPSLQFERDQRAGKFPPASRFFFMPGMAPPNGGPDAILMKGTSVLHAVYEVSTGAEARAAVSMMAGRQLKHVKIWVDDRRGTYPKMTPEVYNAVIDEAHAHHMLVHAHAIAMEDQKAVVRAGADVLVHTVANEKLDDELINLLKEKRPYWTTVIGLGDRSEACDGDPFIDQSYPASALAAIRQNGCGAATANAANREAMLANNVPKMVAAGARLVLGTDAGITTRHAFGWADHHEIARWVDLGLTPAQAIAAATARPAELLGINDLGTLAVGKSADFIVLDANPLENIRNTRKIASVYLRGARLNRDALASAFKNAGAGR